MGGDFGGLALARMALPGPSLAIGSTAMDVHAPALFVVRRHARHGGPVTPAILELLGDGLPRSRHDIVAALAPQHPKDEVVRTLMRLAVTGRLVEAERKYRLAPPPEPDLG